MTTTNITDKEVIVRVPLWLMRAEQLASREMIGHITRASAKGIYFEGHASSRPTDNCRRCGRLITEAVSRLIGYGPWCCDELGIPRNPDPTQVEEYRRQIESHTWAGWLPRLRVEVADAETGASVALRGTQRLSEPDTPHPSEVGEAPPEEDEGPDAEPEAAVIRVSLTVERPGVISVRAPFEQKEAIKTIPGRLWRASDKVWTIPASPDAAQAALEVFAGCEITKDAAVDELLGQIEVRAAATVHKATTEAEGLPPVPVSKTDAWHHQRQAYWFAAPLQAAGLFMDMGTGKSKVVVDLVVNRQHRRTLILCPKSVVGVWPREFDRHGGMATNVVAPLGGTKSRAKVIKAALDLEPVDVPVVAVVNYESAWRPDLEELLLSVQWDLVVLDESHKIKKPSGVASRFVARLGRKATHRLCLTGTPMPHSPLDVYGQYRFLDPGIFGGSFARFRSHYAVMGGYGGHEVLGYQNEAELAERMYRIGFRVMADDVLDLPPVMHETRTAPMGHAARTIYDDLEADLFAEVGKGSISASNALVKLLRLQQITSGSVPVEGEDEEAEPVLMPIDDAKEKLLADLLDGIPINEPVVVFARFTPDLAAVRRVCEAQGRRYGELSGNSRDGLTATAEMSPDIDVIGVQIQSGGVGIDLTRARYAIYYSTGFSLGDYEQSLARVHRPGQTRPTTYYHLEVERSIDQRVTEALLNRKDVVEFVLGLAD